MTPLRTSSSVADEPGRRRRVGAADVLVRVFEGQDVRPIAQEEQQHLEPAGLEVLGLVDDRVVEAPVVGERRGG